MHYFTNTNAVPVYALRFHETVHDKWCIFKSVPQTQNGLERGFCLTLAKLRLNNWPLRFKWYGLVCLSFDWIHDIHRGAYSNEHFLLHINVPWCDGEQGWRRGETLVRVHFPSPKVSIFSAVYAFRVPSSRDPFSFYCHSKAMYTRIRAVVNHIFFFLPAFV